MKARLNPFMNAPKQNLRQNLKAIFPIFMAGFIFTLAALSITTLTPATAKAHDTGSEHGGKGHHFEPQNNPPPTEPGQDFSGDQSIDLKNGIDWNRGTYGVPNPDTESWAKTSTWAVGLAERAYPYEAKTHFIDTLNERIEFYENAVINWKRKSSITKPEVVAYADKAVQDVSPRVDAARKAWSAAKASGKSSWDKAQEEAKRAFLDLQNFYYNLHRNVR